MPENVGPYRIVRRIATGGMAEVYLARQQGMEGLERAVVLKRIHAQYANDEEFVTMFLDEARLMAALSHPNIAQVFDLGRVGDSYYLIMEYVRGPTLDAMLRAVEKRGGRALPLPAALPIVMQVAEALAYLHDVRDEFGRPLHVVHRDLNPLNVIVGYNGSVKLIDFGIAKTAVKVYETRQGVVKGTYGYISPEQLTAKGNVDFRADMFSLGVLFYELCLGELPFGPGEAPDLLDRIRHARYTRPQKIAPSFPPRLEALIARCLAADPAARPPSMQAFIDELAAYMSSTGVLPTLSRVAETVRTMVPEPEDMAPLMIRRVAKQKARDDGDEEDTIIATVPTGALPDSDDLGDATGTSKILLRGMGGEDDERTDATIRKIEVQREEEPTAAPARRQQQRPASPPKPASGPPPMLSYPPASPWSRGLLVGAVALVVAGVVLWFLRGR